MEAPDGQSAKLVACLAANLACYTLWIVCSALAGDFKPPGSSFPYFFLGYAAFGLLLWLPVGYGYFGWASAGAERAQLLWLVAAGGFACCGTMFFFRGLAVSSDADRAVVYVVAAAYPAVTFLVAYAVGWSSSGGGAGAAAGEFARKLGYDPGNVGKNVGLGLVMAGIVLIAAFKR